MCVPEVVLRLGAVLSSHADISDCSWCLFVVSTERQSCQCLAESGLVATSLIGVLQNRIQNNVSTSRRGKISVNFELEDFVVFLKWEISLFFKLFSDGRTLT